MSLLNKKKKTEDRQELTTESTLIEKQREKTRTYQKEQRERHLENWKAEKGVIDSLSGDGLQNYINLSEEGAHDPRVGLHSMKINPHEHAVIKKALELSGARSSRELFVNYCKEVIKNSN